MCGGLVQYELLQMARQTEGRRDGGTEEGWGALPLHYKHVKSFESAQFLSAPRIKQNTFLLRTRT